MERTKEFDLWISQKPEISDEPLYLSKIKDFVEQKESIKSKKEAILRFVRNPEDLQNNLRKWIFFNLEGEKFQLFTCNKINDKEKLEEVKDADEFHTLIKENHGNGIHASKEAIVAAANGGLLHLFLNHRGPMGLYVDGPEANWLIFQKLDAAIREPVKKKVKSTRRQ